MTTATAPTASDIQLVNWAGRPLAEWVTQRKGRSVNFWASEDGQWAYFQRFSLLHEGSDYSTARQNISYDHAGHILAKM